jgi:hypothetical protein
VVDGIGNPLNFILSSGNRNDICLAQELLESFDLQGKLIIAHKGYDSDKFVRWIEEQGGIVIIPSRVTAKCPREIDKDIYHERHLVEYIVASSGYIKLADNFPLFIDMKNGYALPEIHYLGSDMTGFAHCWHGEAPFFLYP